MNCGQAREYLIAFLDSELDAPLSIELQRHLDGCAQCARDAEIECTVRKQLVQTSQGDQTTIPPFNEASHSWWHDSVFVPLQQGTLLDRSPGRWTRFLGAAAVLAMLTTLSWWFQPSQSDTARHHAQLADLLVADFEHFLEEGKVQITSDDAQVVGNWLVQQTALAIALPVSRDPQCKLLGGRKCKIDGRSAGFAVYDMHGIPSSLVVMAADDVNLTGLDSLEHEGVTHWIGHRNGYTVLARRRDGLLYAVVSASPWEQLTCLVADGAYESD